MSASALQRIEIIAWWKTKKALGTYKTKAREMGLKPEEVAGCVFSYRENEGLYRRKRARTKSRRRSA